MSIQFALGHQLRHIAGRINTFLALNIAPTFHIDSNGIGDTSVYARCSTMHIATPIRMRDNRAGAKARTLPRGQSAV